MAQAEESRGQILQVIRRIPRGHVATYGQVAELAGLPGRARLVGRVLRDDASVDVPWHRVVNARGTVSTRGGGENEQRLRLSGEGVQFDETGRIDLSVYCWMAE